MDILLYFILPIFTAIGASSTFALGAVSVYNSVETGSPLDFIFIIVCLAVCIPCAAWTVYACWSLGDC